MIAFVDSITSVIIDMLPLYVCHLTVGLESLQNPSPANANRARQSDQQNHRRLHDLGVGIEPYPTMLHDLRVVLSEDLRSPISECLCRARSYLCTPLCPASCRQWHWDPRCRRREAAPTSSCRR